MINKNVEVKVAFSESLIESGSQPKTYRGLLVDKSDQSIKLKITYKKKRNYNDY